LRSLNLRGRYDGMVELGSREEEVDVFCLQEVAVNKEDGMYGIEGYEGICGVGGYVERGEGSVVGMLISEVWKRKYEVIGRSQVRIGISLEVGEGRRVSIWNVYVGKGKHEGFNFPEGRGNVVVLGDFNAWSRRWGGMEEVNTREGRIVEEWVDGWGMKVVNEVGCITREDDREGYRGRVLDLAICGGELETRCRVGEEVIGLDHKPLEVDVRMEGWTIDKDMMIRKEVDWEKLERELRLWGGEVDWNERIKMGRRGLDEVVESLEDGLGLRMEECRGRRKWKGGRKKWWDESLEEKRKELIRREKEWKREGGEGLRELLLEERREYKREIEEKKGNYWKGYMENMTLLESFKFVKTDRDFVVDVPGIRGEDGILVEEDGKKGEAILRGLGKREELDQEEEGFEGEVHLEEELVEECVFKQKDGKAVGINGIGGRTVKMVWKLGWGREVLMKIMRRSLELGYVPRRFRESIGVVMRKPKKPDYSLPGSYRVINLLDVVGKGLERVVVKLLGKWGQEGMGDEQWGAREGRSSMEAVGKLMMGWERGGGLGLLLCMDVKGGYENVGVWKMEERLKGLGVDEFLRKWVSAFLRDRRARERIGRRIGDWVKLKGGTIQGSPLSPMLFMFMLGGVLEEVKKERVEGMEVVAVVDDVDFMVVGKCEEEVLRRVGWMERGLERGLKKWEIEVQVLKLEGMWMDKESKERTRVVRWLGNEIRREREVRVLGVWWQGDGGWESHVLRRIGLAERRWRMLMKLLGRNGNGVCVEVLVCLMGMVVMKVLMYGMELYWDGNKDMKGRLEIWRNRGLRRILGAVRTTPIDAMVGEVGWRDLGLEMDRKVEGWGKRMKRRGFLDGWGEGWGEEALVVGSWKLNWQGRMLRGLRRHKLFGERWEVEAERSGKLNWEVRMGGKKEDKKRIWEEGRVERNRSWLVGLSDASDRGGRMGIGGVLWEYGRRYKSWKNNLGLGLTVTEGEMEGVGRVLLEALEYKGMLRKLVVGVDNVGVLKRLIKGRGLCGECEQRVRERGSELLRKGWTIRWEWVPGHVGVRENEEVDKLAKEGVFMEEELGIGSLLTWGRWEQRRNEEEWRAWKEFWLKRRKGRKYVGRGKGMEKGHGGCRVESLFLFWMRVGHGKMRGTRYGKEEKRCECGLWEDRDHVLLECRRWKEQREGI